jgi:hypothetical protein
MLMAFGLPELQSVFPVITISPFLVPVTMLPTVPLEAVADPTTKGVVFPWLMVIFPALAFLPPPPVPVAKAEML